MRIKFWGVRGSIPSPVRSETIRVKIKKALMGAQDVDLNDPDAVAAYIDSLPLKIRGTSGGNTSCVEIHAADRHLILDAGSGLRDLGDHLMQGAYGRGEGTAHIFISHTHWDHIQGFPFFVPAYVPGNRFWVYSGKTNIKDRFTIQQIDQDMFPMSLDDMGAGIDFVTIGPSGVDLGGVKVDSLALQHPGGSWAYRIKTHDKTLVYATDGEYSDLSPENLQVFLDFFSGADALIFDAMFTMAESLVKKGWGHSTSLVGVDMALKSGVKRLVLFHHGPSYNDAQLSELLEITKNYYADIKEAPPLEIIMAYEGGEMEI